MRRREFRGRIKNAAEVKSRSCWQPSIQSSFVVLDHLHPALQVIPYKSGSPCPRLRVVRFLLPHTHPSLVLVDLSSPFSSCTILQHQLPAFATRPPGANTPLTLESTTGRRTPQIEIALESFTNIPIILLGPFLGFIPDLSPPSLDFSIFAFEIEPSSTPYPIHSRPLLPTPTKWQTIPGT
jgi:hypothetical protein